MPSLDSLPHDINYLLLQAAASDGLSSMLTLSQVCKPFHNVYKLRKDQIHKHAELCTLRNSPHYHDALRLVTSSKDSFSTPSQISSATEDASLQATDSRPSPTIEAEAARLHHSLALLARLLSTYTAHQLTSRPPLPAYTAALYLWATRGNEQDINPSVSYPEDKITSFLAPFNDTQDFQIAINQVLYWLDTFAVYILLNHDEHEHESFLWGKCVEATPVFSGLWEKMKKTVLHLVTDWFQVHIFRAKPGWKILGLGMRAWGRDCVKWEETMGMDYETLERESKKSRRMWYTLGVEAKGGMGLCEVGPVLEHLGCLRETMGWSDFGLDYRGLCEGG